MTFQEQEVIRLALEFVIANRTNAQLLSDSEYRELSVACELELSRRAMVQGPRYYAELSDGRMIGLTKLAYADPRLLSRQLGEAVKRCFRTQYEVLPYCTDGDLVEPLVGSVA